MRLLARSSEDFGRPSPALRSGRSPPVPATWAGQLRRASARAFTLVEITVTAGLLVVLLPAIWEVYHSGQRYLFSLQERSSAASDVRLHLKGVADELQEAIRLIHPQPGATTADGVGFVTASGEVVFYFVDGRLPAGQRVLWRQELLGGETVAVVRDVEHFRVTVPAVEPGFEPAFAMLDLCQRSPLADREFNAITGVFLSAVEPEVPE